MVKATAFSVTPADVPPEPPPPPLTVTVVVAALGAVFSAKANTENPVKLVSTVFADSFVVEESSDQAHDDSLAHL